MFELIPIAVGLSATVYGHMKSRRFVRKRLRYTSWVEKPGLGIAAGVTTAIVAAPVVGLIPFLGLGVGTALFIGAGVGTGVAMGAKDAKEGSIFDED